MKYTLRRKILVLLGKEFSIVDESDHLVAYAKQKAFKLREEINLFEDREMKSQMINIKARNILDFSATYDVKDSKTGEIIGSLKRMGVRSLFRDEWHIYTPGGNEYGVIKEESSVLAFFRRIVSNLVPQRFDLRIKDTDAGGFEQQFNLFRYVLNIDVNETLLDKKMAFAAAVLLGAIEGRQE